MPSPRPYISEVLPLINQMPALICEFELAVGVAVGVAVGAVEDSGAGVGVGVGVGVGAVEDSGAGVEDGVAIGARVSSLIAVALSPPPQKFGPHV